MNADGSANFYRLLFRRGAPFDMAFDVLMLDGEDVRSRPLLPSRCYASYEVDVESCVAVHEHISPTGAAGGR